VRKNEGNNLVPYSSFPFHHPHHQERAPSFFATTLSSSIPDATLH
jgi:hypothetical protein